MNIPNNNIIYGLFTLGVVGASMHYYFKEKKERSYYFYDLIKKVTSYSKSKAYQEELNGYMIKELENKIIIWKKKNIGKSDDYYQFLIDCFPENIKTKGDTITWVDERANNKWLKIFNNVGANDKLHNLGNPPDTIHL